MKMQTKKSLLRILKVSNIYGGLLSLITVGAYLFFAIGFPGTFRYLPIQAFLLLLGVVSVTVFSYLHLNYYEKASDEAVCSLPIGAIITLMCLIPGLIIALFEINILSMGVSALLLHPWMLGIFIFGNFGLVLGFLPGELEMWKIKGLQLSTAILIAGVIVTGISVSLGTVGKTVISYEVMLDTGTSEEETTFFLPVPIDESIGEVADVMNELKVVDGTGDWKIVDTANTTLRIDLAMDDGTNNILSNISVGSTPTEPFTYEVPLKEGWQTVRLARRLLCYD